MKVLIADKFQPSGIAALKELGCDLVSEPNSSAESLHELVGDVDPDVLVVRSTKVSAQAIAAGKRLSLIIRAGAGFDTIDLSEASRRGIFVANCPGKNSVAVAEIAWGLILACDRRIPDQTIELRAGQWNKKEYSKAAGLNGRTLGIVGTGQIGMEIAARGLAFGMHVVAWSRSLTPEKARQLGVGFCASLAELAKQSDVVSVNVAQAAETTRLIDGAFIDAMKPGATLINTSRGSVVDSDALMQGIRTKGLRAGLDVFAAEPAGATGEFADPIAKLPGVYGTHHVGASTDEAQEAIAAEAVRIVQVYKATGQVPNCVNLAHKTPATSLLSVRHLNKPGVLAHVFDVIDAAGGNVEEMENIIYDGAHAALARIQLDAPLPPEYLAKISENANVLAVGTGRIGEG